MALILDEKTRALPSEIHQGLELEWARGHSSREKRLKARRTPPLVRLWDGDWELMGVVHGELDGHIRWKMNDVGEGVIVLPAKHRLARRVLNPLAGDTDDKHLTVDKDGARWSGKMKTARLTKTSDGTRAVELTFLHDYQQVKQIYCWPNPFLPAAVQFPRSFILAGPAAWTLKTMLFVNLLRLEGDLWALPDDPLDITTWANAFFPQTWNIMVAPGSLLLDPTPWTLVSSRMKTWHDMAQKTLADAQLSVECRRYLDGDPAPWPGYTPRHGQLIVDVVDKSGWWNEEGTSFFGDIWSGLVRTVQKVAGNNIDTDVTVIDEPVEVPEYQDSNWLGTVPQAPYVVYRDGAISGVEAADFERSPAQAVQIIGGGHSAYGVNETLSAGVQLAGNILGTFVMVPSAGTIADIFLRPLYEDTIAAWMSVKSIDRAQSLGWAHYHEYFAEGSDRAYTLSGLLAMRKAMWDTREKTSHKLELRDGAPWFIGDRGQGHFFLGDRVGSTIQGIEGDVIVVEQVTELEYSWSRDSRGWTATCGDPVTQASSAEKIVGNIQNVASAIHDLGLI
ncbi:phage tail protein [Corynebacteriaceae bacterium 6-324]